MPNIVNLGQFGAPRESVLSGLGDAIGNGIKLGIASKTVLVTGV